MLDALALSPVPPDEYFNPFGEDCDCLSGWNIYGIGLSEATLRKIYYENAEKMLKLINSWDYDAATRKNQ